MRGMRSVTGIKETFDRFGSATILCIGNLCANAEIQTLKDRTFGTFNYIFSEI